MLTFPFNPINCKSEEFSIFNFSNTLFVPSVLVALGQFIYLYKWSSRLNILFLFLYPTTLTIISQQFNGGLFVIEFTNLHPLFSNLKYTRQTLSQKLGVLFIHRLVAVTYRGLSFHRSVTLHLILIPICWVAGGGDARPLLLQLEI